MADVLRLACADIEAPPLFHASGGGQDRRGFEPDVGRAVAEALGRPLRWRFLPWAEMLPSVPSGVADGVLCGQGITAESMRTFIASLDLPADARKRLEAMTPATYVGLAERLAREI